MALVGVMETNMNGTVGGMTADRPVDLVHLARHTLGNRDLEREVLRLFVRQSRMCLARLRAAHSSAERRSAAHTIKGSARGIGAWRIAELADAFEHLPDSAEKVDERDYADLTAAIESANDYIRDVLSDA